MVKTKKPCRCATCCLSRMAGADWYDAGEKRTATRIFRLVLNHGWKLEGDMYGIENWIRNGKKRKLVEQGMAGELRRVFGIVNTR